MSEVVIQVESISKRYTIGHQRSASHGTLRDKIQQTGLSVFNTLKHSFRKKSRQETYEDFWALKDISFEVNQGDRIGVVGRNGAGKSTLLKVLSRITEPTTGRIKIRGRVASLLEVGTGFHPELTGRENIFLNGSILGMSKLEIQQKFDEIVAFAEVEKFLDTPVKRYSSGMYVRLAFAVAAHLEPEILMVDEVLAVGDAQFQQKCLGKMEDVAKQGRTVIFISHNMGSIVQLCNRGICLESGQIAHVGDINSVVSKYLSQGQLNSHEIQLVDPDSDSTVRGKKFFFRKLGVYQGDQDLLELDVRHPFCLNLDYEITQPLTNVEVSVRIHTSDGMTVITTSQSDCSPESLKNRESGRYYTSIKFPGLFLMPGSYMVTIAAHIPMIEILDIHEYVLTFKIAETGTKFASYGEHRNIGVVMLNLPWIEKTSDDYNS